MKYTVYGLDIWPDGEGGWQENDRFEMGEIDLSESEPDEAVLDKLERTTYRPSWLRHEIPLLNSKRRSKVTVVDLYGGGDWLEVQNRVDERPIYGLQRVY